MSDQGESRFSSQLLLTRDGWVLFGTRMVRLFAYGLLSVVLVLYLSAIGMSDQYIGLLLTLTLVGDAVISLLITRVADRLGRRRMLLLGAGLMIFAGATFALTTNPLLLTVAAFIGTLSPSGNEVGPFLAIEQAALAHITPDQQRTRVFAWYILCGSLAAALGALTGGMLETTSTSPGNPSLAGYRALFMGYGVLGIIMGLLFTTLSPKVEVVPLTETRPVGFSGLHRSRVAVRNLSLLFMLDSFGSGLMVQSVLAYWFHLRFGVDTATLGRLFFGVYLVAGLSALVAARIAARVGLIRTMVFTHIPANIFLLLTPLMPTLPLAITMVLLRFCVAQMDVPTRQSYLMAVVDPDERSAAAGITTFARTTATALAPTLTGVLFGAAFFSAPFFLAGGLKIVYDLALYVGFRHLKPPEEREKS